MSDDLLWILLCSADSQRAEKPWSHLLNKAGCRPIQIGNDSESNVHLTMVCISRNNRLFRLCCHLSSAILCEAVYFVYTLLTVMVLYRSLSFLIEDLIWVLYSIKYVLHILLTVDFTPYSLYLSGGAFSIDWNDNSIANYNMTGVGAVCDPIEIRFIFTRFWRELFSEIISQELFSSLQKAMHICTSIFVPRHKWLSSQYDSRYGCWVC